MKVYLDNNATTRIDPEVVNEMMPYLTEIYGNPSSMHDFGVPVSKALDVARHRVRDFIGAEKDSEIIFTACATESDNTAIYSAKERKLLPPWWSILQFFRYVHSLKNTAISFTVFR